MSDLYSAPSNWLLLHKNYLYSELFWSVFSRILSDYGEIQSIQNNSNYGLFSRSVLYKVSSKFDQILDWNYICPNLDFNGLYMIDLNF